MNKFRIDGATCGGCVKSIEKAISQVAGVEAVEFSLETKEAVVTGSAEFKAITDAVEGAGFDILTETN